MPESELRAEFTQYSDGSVGDYKTPDDVPEAMFCAFVSLV
jgi:hypothetical protein